MFNSNERQIHQFSHHTLMKELTKRNLSTSGRTGILKTRLIRNCEGYGQQCYNFLAVIDFEATCVAHPPVPPNRYIQEIIEFPIILIDVAKQTIIDRFHSYCRPILRQTLSNFCKQLTGITQEQVDKAPVFPDVFANVEKWLNDKDLLTNPERKCIFVTDSPCDFNKYLQMQCEISDITYPNWAYQWINIKNTFSTFYSINSGRIRNMLNSLGLPFHGNLHSGLDDATNIAKIVIQLIEDGCILAPNEFYHRSSGRFEQKSQSSTISNGSRKMKCLICSRFHSEDQRSCVQRAPQRQKRHQSDYSESYPNKRTSLPDSPISRPSKRVPEQRSQFF